MPFDAFSDDGSRSDLRCRRESAKGSAATRRPAARAGWSRFRGDAWSISAAPPRPASSTSRADPQPCMRLGRIRPEPPLRVAFRLAKDADLGRSAPEFARGRGRGYAMPELSGHPDPSLLGTRALSSDGSVPFGPGTHGRSACDWRWRIRSRPRAVGNRLGDRRNFSERGIRLAIGRARWKQVARPTVNWRLELRNVNQDRCEKSVMSTDQWPDRLKFQLIDKLVSHTVCIFNLINA